MLWLGVYLRASPPTAPAALGFETVVESSGQGHWITCRTSSLKPIRPLRAAVSKILPAACLHIVHGTHKISKEDSFMPGGSYMEPRLQGP